MTFSCSFAINKFDDEHDFILFENENEVENVPGAKNARHENYSIDDELNSRDFFDDMNDERAFQALYS